mgnify:CR=1 FL=1
MVNNKPDSTVHPNHNGIADLEKLLTLRDELLAIEEDRLHGETGYSVDEVTAMMEDAIKEVYSTALY